MKIKTYLCNEVKQIEVGATLTMPQRAMKTYKELKQFVEKQGCVFECSKGDYSHHFGINNPTGRKGASEWQWVWFESIGEELNDETIFFPSHRYSISNGKYYKGWQEKIRMEEIIERVIA